MEDGFLFDPRPPLYSATRLDDDEVQAATAEGTPLADARRLKAESVAKAHGCSPLDVEGAARAGWSLEKWLGMKAARTLDAYEAARDRHAAVEAARRQAAHEALVEAERMSVR